MNMLLNRNILKNVNHNKFLSRKIQFIETNYSKIIFVGLFGSKNSEKDDIIEAISPSIRGYADLKESHDQINCSNRKSILNCQNDYNSSTDTVKISNPEADLDIFGKDIPGIETDHLVYNNNKDNSEADHSFAFPNIAKFHQFYCSAYSKDHISYAKSFVDHKIIRCISGKGGNGTLSYIRHGPQKLVGPGCPCGGGGGKGGDVIVSVSKCLSSLSHLKRTFVAEDGKPGNKRNMNGLSGCDAVLEVPRGCIVRKFINEDSRQISYQNIRHSKKKFLGDLDNLNFKKIIIARGGTGGKGNNWTNPHTFTEGSPGEDVYIEIELKSIADIGLVGFPNSGKSTLLSAISHARPKIAPYPFTTLAPHIGVIEFDDCLKISVADIPGIIEGSHMNYALGIDFLRHIERTKILLFLIDVSCCAQYDPMQSFLLLRKEIELYSSEMLEKRYLVVANKCDIFPIETLQRADKFWRILLQDFGNVRFIPISARFGEGILDLIKAIREEYLESIKIL